MAVRDRVRRIHIQWAWVVLFCVVLEPWRAPGQIATEGPSISSASCREEYLVAVENQTQGVVVNVLNKHSKQVLEYREFKDRYLSSQCGDHYFRCQDLLVVRSTSTTENDQYIVFVPLINGVLLLRFSCNGKYIDHSIVPIHNAVCSPTAIFKILEPVIVVCLNQETRYLATLRIDLNSSSIKDSGVGNLHPLNFNGLTSPPHLSNFKYVNSDNSDIQISQWILYASSNYVYTDVPLTDEMGPSYILGDCSIPESLVYVPDDILLVYCHDDSAVYFNLAYGNVINQTQYSEHGQPFLCPNPDVHIAVFASASYIQYCLWSNNSRVNFNIHEMKFDSGVCFGSKTRTLFAYNDKNSGVYILDAASSDSNHIQLSSKPCLNSQCEPLMIFENRYVVIREREKYDSNVIVVDSQQDYQAIISAQHVKADLLTLLIEENATSCSDGSQSTSNLPPVLGGQTVAKVVGSVCGVLVLLMIVCSGIVVIVCRKYIQRKNGSHSVHYQETIDAVSQSDSDGDSQQRENTAVGDVSHESRTSNPDLNEEPPGDPTFGLLLGTKQVYPSLGHQCPLLLPAENQPITHDPHPIQESSAHNSNNTTTTGDFTTPRANSGVILLQQASSSEQTSACTSIAPSDRESSSKPSATAYPLSAETSYVDNEEWAIPSIPESETNEGREHESDDELILGSDRAVPQKKSLYATKLKMRRKRAERGDYKNCDYQNLTEQLVMEELEKD